MKNYWQKIARNQVEKMPWAALAVILIGMFAIHTGCGKAGERVAPLNSVDENATTLEKQGDLSATATKTLVAGENNKDKQSSNSDDIKAQIQAAVARGELTPEQAKEKLAALEKSKNKQSPSSDDIKAQIQAAVARGELTPEQAQKKLAVLEIQAAVARGELTPEQAKEKLAALEKS